MAIYKITKNGADALMDLSDSTVDVDSLATGVIAYNSRGEKITGELTIKPEQIKSVSYTSNGQYTLIPDDGKTLSAVSVDVSVSGSGIVAEPLTVTSNGTYTAPTGKAYTPVTVNVSGGGGTDVYEAINRQTNVNVSDTNLTTVMARGIYAGTEAMETGDSLTAGVIYIQYE